MTSMKFFVAYPSHPETIGKVIKEASLFAKNKNIDIKTWEDMDIAGRIIPKSILEEIKNRDTLISDITKLNINVMFEIGFALGCQRHVLPVMNEQLDPEQRDLNQIGIIDIIGYKKYSTPETLLGEIEKFSSRKESSVFEDRSISEQTPVYVHIAPNSSASSETKKCLKKAKIRFKVFDPSENSRLSAPEAHQNVSESILTIVHLVGKDEDIYRHSNLKAAFIAGLSLGMNKNTCIFHEGNSPIPMDVRDQTHLYTIRNPENIASYLSRFYTQINEQASSKSKIINKALNSTTLRSIDLGSPAAENEAENLSDYYVTTSAYESVLLGQARIAVGRKGSGKTALFYEIFKKVSSARDNIVLDLKPEEYQLKQLKADFARLEVLEEHAVSAFWMYALLLEICNRILIEDESIQDRKKILTEPYRRLRNEYEQQTSIREADFSERLRIISEDISNNKSNYYDSTGKLVISSIYDQKISKLQDDIRAYTQHKGEVWILFDNLDKGWSTRGVEEADIVILKGLLDATRKIEKLLNKSASNKKASSVVFIRNDVYERLVEQSVDRGKESKVKLDWEDSSLLKEMLRRRLVHKMNISSISFEDIWSRIAVSHINGERSIDYLIDRSLMRPRNLINLIRHCKSNAINMGRDKINDEDIKKAHEIYSADLADEMSLEVRDIFPQVDSIVYLFLDGQVRMSIDQVRQVLSNLNLSNDEFSNLVEMLVWFGFFGIDHPQKGVSYIYENSYNIKKMEILAGGFCSGKVSFVIHKAFRPFLEFDDID